MALLSDRSLRSEKVLILFYDFETTQNTRSTDTSFEQVPNIVCVQKFCAKCEEDADVNVDCQRYGKRRYSLWTDPVGDIISYTIKSRPWADRIVDIAHNEKAFELQFVLNRLVRMKMVPELLITKGQKLMCLKLPSHATQKFTRVIQFVGRQIVVPTSL